MVEAFLKLRFLARVCHVLDKRALLDGVVLSDGLNPASSLDHALDFVEIAAENAGGLRIDRGFVFEFVVG